MVARVLFDELCDTVEKFIDFQRQFLEKFGPTEMVLCKRQLSQLGVTHAPRLTIFSHFKDLGSSRSANVHELRNREKKIWERKSQTLASEISPPSFRFLLSHSSNAADEVPLTRMPRKLNYFKCIQYRQDKQKVFSDHSK